MSHSDRAGSAGGRCMGGSRLAETPWADSQLYRVLQQGPVPDKLPHDGRASLAATCWGALEMVLRDTRAVLKVHPDDAVLAGLAQRMKDGPCTGEVTVCGVRVRATDARALLRAAVQLGCRLPVGVADPFFGFRTSLTDNNVEYDNGAKSVDETFAWVELVTALTAQPSGARVTGLIMPTMCDRPTVTAEAEAVAEVLCIPAVRDSVQRLQVFVEPDLYLPDEAHWALFEAIEDLSALQHLKLIGVPGDWARLIGLISSLTSVTLVDSNEGCNSSDPDISPKLMVVFLDALEQATNLRKLELPDAYVADACVALPPRALPVGLEVLCMSCFQPLYWWEATELRSLRLLGPNSDVGAPDVPVWERLAQLINCSKKLRRLVLGKFRSHLDLQQVLPVCSALEHSAVEELVFDEPIDVCDDSGTSKEFCRALNAALGRVVRNNASLRELRLLGTSCSSGDRVAVVTALRDNTTLRELELEWGDEAADLGAALGATLSRNTSLEELAIAFAWTPEGWHEVLQGLGENRTLQALRCGYASHGQGITDRDVLDLVDALYGGDRHEGRQLHTFEICGAACPIPLISDLGVESVTAVLEDPSSKLRRVALERVRLGVRGVACIVRALERNTFVSLELRGSVDLDSALEGGAWRRI
ncbi:unnamed protein product [Pedinophyceae sp. YPF-701]|nr:unnamed protein product [Pedinophyceae sp. YPF-701]